MVAGPLLELPGPQSSPPPAGVTTRQRLPACAPARLPACLLCYTRPGLRHQPNTIFLPVCLPACLRLQEYADFLKQVEMESTAAAAELAHDEEAEAAGRLDREDFEQL